MGIGFDQECTDVARRIQAEAKRRESHATISKAATVFDAVKLLARYATRLHRSYENACNCNRRETRS